MVAFIRNFALCTMFLVVSHQAHAGGALRIIPRQEVCTKLQTGVRQISSSQGIESAKIAMTASVVTEDLVAGFKAGRATDYINPKVLGGREGYIPMAQILAPAIGIDPAKTILALSVGELRFIPHVQQDMNILVIAQNAAPLTPERAKAVAATANKLRIKIHVLWVGDQALSGATAQPVIDQPEASATSKTSEVDVEREAKALAFLATVTGGSFADLSGPDHCGKSL